MARRLWQVATMAAVVCMTGLNGFSSELRDDATLRRRIGPGSIAAGRAHTLVATPDGRVFAWGAGDRGQIGDGALVTRSSPTIVSGLDSVLTVAAGAAHSLAVTEAGDLFAWGANGFGRLGDGTQQRRPRPVRVSSITHVRAVAAGRAHSLAATSDGRVFAWGRNHEGQLGIGSRRSSLTPVEVRGLEHVVAVAAGEFHSLALTSEGRVFAWGSNQSSQLGDGSRNDRTRPIAVGLSDIVAIAAGDAHSLALSRSGVVYSWGKGASGQLGTGVTRISSTPTRVANLSASLVAAGGNSSAAIMADGRVATWGANGSGQLGDQTTLHRSRPRPVAGLENTVSLALGAAHAIAVTREGDVRTWGEGSSGQLGTGVTADAGRPTEILSDVPGWGAGAMPDPPAAPAMTPRAGVFAAPQVVTLTTSSGAVIRYTLDGTAPTDSSPLYSGPIVVSSTATVSARTFASGQSSETVSEHYIIDTEPPSIVATTSPPLSGGWMTTPVTIAFECSDNVGIASCPAPLTISTDTVQRQVTGVAVDTVGHESVATVTVSVDVSPPTLSVSTPVDGASVSDERVSVVATAEDVSGIAAAFCNGAATLVADGRVTCDVALLPGRNDVVIRAIDLVGHATAVAMTLTRVGPQTRMTLSPKSRSLGVNEIFTFELVDEFGVRVDQATWSSSDASVVSLSLDDPPLCVGLKSGEVTIRAEKDGMVAEAAVVITAGTSPGDVRWSLASTPDYSAEPPLIANRVDPSVPHMFAIETQTWGQALLRAVDDEGRVLWQQHAPGIPLMADAFGGVIAGVLADVTSGSDFRAYVRLGGGTTRPWRFDSAGAIGRPAQAPDGTLFAIEYLPGGLNSEGAEIVDKYVLVLNGTNGNVIARRVLPRQIENFTATYDGLVLDTTPPIQCRSKRYEWAPDVSGPVIGSDGRAYFAVPRWHIEQFADCIEPFRRRPDRTIELGLDLIAVAADGQASTVSVYSTSCTAALGTTLPCDLPVRQYQVMPDALGGTLVTWERGTGMVGNSVFVQKSLSRIDVDSTIAEQPVSPGFWIEMIGQSGTAIVSDDAWKAIDVVSGATQWANPLAGLAPLAARPDGGLAALDVATGELKVTNAVGEIEGAQPFGLDWWAVQQSGNWVGLRNGELTSVVGQFDDATRFASLAGNRQHQLAIRTPGIGLWLKAHNAFGPVPFQHVSIRVTPKNQQWLINNRSKFESCGDPSQCVPLGTDAFGNLFFTIGAGSGSDDTNLQCNGVLTKGFNRSRDVTEPPSQPLREIPVDPTLQPLLISSLVTRTDAFANDLLYYCFPEERPGFYNSNSFAHGLLHAASVAHDETPPGNMPMPGWLTPVPNASFFKR